MPDLLPIGMIVRSRYKIDKVIWETRLMNVYYVHDLHLPGNAWVLREMQMVAVDEQDIKKIIKNFEQEALKISSLSHPQLATVIDFFQEGKNLYIVREYVSGIDLESLSNKIQKPFSEPEVILWATQIAELLSFLYSKKLPAIFYREFSMKNIIRMSNGGVKLIDLGIARVFQTEDDEESLKRMGSIEYAAPEQFSDQGSFDARSLVYSLGSFMHHALTSVNPSSSPFDLKSVNILNPTVSKRTQEIIKTATAIEPKNRYQNLQEMKKELTELLKSPKAQAQNEGEVREQKNKILDWVIGIIIIILSVIFIYYFILHY